MFVLFRGLNLMEVEQATRDLKIVILTTDARGDNSLCAHALPTSRSLMRTPRRKARDLVKIDVNKTSRVWDFLVQAGFLKITPDPPHAAPQDTSYVYIVPLELDTDELPKYERHLPYSAERISIQGGVAPPTTFFRGRDSSCQSKWIWSPD
jgi:hypothetical protein